MTKRVANDFWLCEIDEWGNVDCPRRGLPVHYYDYCDCCSHKEARIGQSVTCRWAKQVQHEPR